MPCVTLNAVMKRLTIIFGAGFLILNLGAGPVLSGEREVEATPESIPAYIVLSFIPVSGNQVPAVVHSLGNDYFYYREEDSDELRAFDGMILEGSPFRILLNGRAVREVAFDARGRGNSLGDILYVIPTGEGEQRVGLEIAPVFNPIRLNFLGREIEVRPEAVSLSPTNITVKAAAGEVRHIQVEDFAVDITAISEEEEPAVFGLKYWMSLELDQRVYSNLEEIRDRLRSVFRRPSLKLEPLAVAPAGPDGEEKQSDDEQI